MDNKFIIINYIIYYLLLSAWLKLLMIHTSWNFDFYTSNWFEKNKYLPISLQYIHSTVNKQFK